MLTVSDVIARALTLPVRSKEYAYKQGFDCGNNGANDDNCDYTIFSCPENTAEWERGKKSGEQSKSNGLKTELRPGIGACDDCGEERWPQQYAGYGIMVCLDCLAPKEDETPYG